MDFESAYKNFIKALKYRNVIGTDTFKKYFINTANRISNYKILFNNIILEYKKLKKENVILENEVIELKTIIKEHKIKFTKKNAELKNIKNLLKESEEENMYNKALILNLENSNENLKNSLYESRQIYFKQKEDFERKIISYEKIRNDLTINSNYLFQRSENKINDLEKKSYSNEMKIINMNKEIDLLNKYIEKQRNNEQDLKYKIEEKEKEIERLKRISWFDKLLGVK